MSMWQKLNYCKCYEYAKWIYSKEARENFRNMSQNNKAKVLEIWNKICITLCVIMTQVLLIIQTYKYILYTYIKGEYLQLYLCIIYSSRDDW